LGQVLRRPIGGDAENYANAHGAKAATLESGSHFEKRSNDVAYRAALSMLSLLDMIERAPDQARGETAVIDMYAVVIKEAEDFRYAGEVSNFKRLARGDVYAMAERSAARCRGGQLPADPDAAGGNQGARGGVLPRTATWRRACRSTDIFRPHAPPASRRGVRSWGQLEEFIVKEAACVAVIGVGAVAYANARAHRRKRRRRSRPPAS
jgi:hypothetical protein